MGRGDVSRGRGWPGGGNIAQGGARGAVCVGEEQSQSSLKKTDLEMIEKPLSKIAQPPFARSLRAKPLNMAEPLIDITSEIEAACAVLDQGEVSHRAAALWACYQWL